VNVSGCIGSTLILERIYSITFFFIYLHFSMSVDLLIVIN
jgi:hypothetical protein